MIDLVMMKIFELATVTAMHTAYELVLTHRKSWAKSLPAALLRPDQRIRISISEILRLRSGDDSYVMIFNKKRPWRFTPIGRKNVNSLQRMEMVMRRFAWLY